MTAASAAAKVEAPMLLSVELLYESPPDLTETRLCDRFSSALPSEKVIPASGADGAFLIEHGDHVFEFKDGHKMPALTAIARGADINSERLSAALRQTWDWPEAAAVIARAKHELVVCELLARVFEPKTRVKIFCDVLRQVVELWPPLALHCQHAERIVNPAKIPAALVSSNPIERMTLILNVRLFRITNGQEGDLLMDTRGLAALGLPDLQMHFRNLEGKRVAALLFNSAVYIYDHGDCIQDGHTIQGLAPDQRWRCQHENALWEPKRMVIDIDPGDPYAAGTRHRKSH